MSSAPSMQRTNSLMKCQIRPLVFRTQEGCEVAVKYSDIRARIDRQIGAADDRLPLTRVVRSASGRLLALRRPPVERPPRRRLAILGPPSTVKSRRRRARRRHSERPR
jgi:hypothetical protein